MLKKRSPVVRAGFDFGEWSTRFVFRYAGWIIAALVLLCALAYPFVKNLELRANFFELLPKNSPSVENLKELTTHVGGTTFLICVIESSDEETARLAAEAFIEKAAGFPGVDYVDNQAGAAAFAGRKLLFLDLESVKKVKESLLGLIAYYRRQANPLFIDLLKEEPPKLNLSEYALEHKIYKLGGFARTADSAMRVVMIKPAHTVGDFAQSRPLFEAAQEAFQEIERGLEKPVTLGLAGPYVTREGEYRTINRDVKFTGFISIVLIIFILLVSFRSFRFLLYALLPLGTGIFLTLGLAEITVGYLNLITAFLVSILLGMGSDYTLNTLVNYTGAYKTRTRVYAAVKHTYAQMWRPLFMSMLTTAVAFCAMTTSRFEGYRHFGLIAGMGIVISFFVVFYGLPSLFILGEKFFPRKKGLRLTPRTFSKKRAALFIGAGVLLSIYSLAVIPKAGFDYDFGNLQAEGEASIKLSDRMAEYYDIQLSPIGIITPGREQAAEIADKINAYIEENPATSFDFAASVLTHVPGKQPEKIAVLREISELIEKRKGMLSMFGEKEKNMIAELRRQLKAEPLAAADLPDSLKRQYEGDGGEISVVYVYPKGRIVDGVVTKRFVQELRSLDLGPGVKLAGDPILFADVLTLLEKDTPFVMTVSVLTIFVLLLVHFRRLDHVLWVLAPVILGLLWMTGLAAAAGLKYNFINLAILPSVLGVGIDSGIYIFERYRNRRGENFYLSLRKTSKGVILAALTTISAFIGLSFADHRGMASMGQLGVLGFLGCLFAAVYFVPSLIGFFESRSKKNLPGTAGRKAA